MLKNNTRGIPNTQVDMTSLMDVIFIVLFVMILGYAKTKENEVKNIEKQYQEMNDEERKVREELEEENAEIIERLTDIQNNYEVLKAEMEARNEWQEENDRLGERVLLISIYSTGNFSDDLSKREIEITIDDEVKDTIQVRDDIENTVYGTYSENAEAEGQRVQGRLEVILREYIDENSDKHIFITCNTRGLLYRDRDKIIRIIERLQQEYEYVF